MKSPFRVPVACNPFRLSPQHALRALAIVVAAGAALTVQARESNVAEAPMATAPWDVPVTHALTDDPYAADPGFAGGQYILDDFYADPNGTHNFFEGKKVARLSNGDLVVAALVKNPNAAQSNGFWNIGLVRYNATGTQRLPWSNGGVYAHVEGQYIVYPKDNAATFSWIQDIQVSGDKILVAVNRNFQGGNDVDTHVLVFGQDGSFKSNTVVFGTGSAEFVGGMTTYSVGFPGTTSVVVVATKAPAAGGLGRPIFRRYTLDPGGTLADATGVVDMNTHWCAVTTRDCRPGGIALGYRSLGVAPAIYVVNRAINPSPAPAREGFTVTRIDGSGVANADWGSFWDVFDDGTSTQFNRAQAIAVRTTGFGTPENPFRDHVFVVAEIQRACANGIVVARFNGDYSLAGRTILGGSSANPILCSVAGQPTDYPVDMDISGDRLAVTSIGKVSQPLVGGGTIDVYTGAVAILDAGLPSGVPLRDFRDFPYPIGGARQRDTGLWGIVPTTGGRFIVVGDARYPNTSDVVPTLRGKNSVATLGISPDRIFGHGFE